MFRWAKGGKLFPRDGCCLSGDTAMAGSGSGDPQAFHGAWQQAFEAVRKEFADSLDTFTKSTMEGFRISAENAKVEFEAQSVLMQKRALEKLMEATGVPGDRQGSDSASSAVEVNMEGSDSAGGAGFQAAPPGGVVGFGEKRGNKIRPVDLDEDEVGGPDNNMAVEDAPDYSCPGDDEEDSGFYRGQPRGRSRTVSPKRGPNPKAVLTPYRRIQDADGQDDAAAPEPPDPLPIPKQLMGPPPVPVPKVPWGFTPRTTKGSGRAREPSKTRRQQERNWESGDWECVNCLAHNYKYNEWCYRCEKRGYG